VRSAFFILLVVYVLEEGVILKQEADDGIGPDGRNKK
jgi:hypothetical protein